MKTAVILAAGKGTRIWPYAEVKPKVMIPVANRPVIFYNIEKLQELGFDTIIIAASAMKEQIVNYYRNILCVKVVDVGQTAGAACSLYAVRDYIREETFLVLYGDTILEKADIAALVSRVESGDEASYALVSPLRNESSGDWVCCSLNGGFIENILGHPREDCTHRFCAFAFHKEFFKYLETNAGIFKNVQVGMMSPTEAYIEMSVADFIRDGRKVSAIETTKYFIDMDKPWHILEANDFLVETKCRELSGNVLGEDAILDPTAQVRGYVCLGRGSVIGRNVIINGSVIIENNTIIENGAIIDGNAVIGSDCYIGNYCYISGGSSIGDRCVVNHCAELDGIIMECVYLYHYMEFYGIIGNNTDLGAATVCGTLRFDDGSTMHRIKSRKELPRNHSNATYLGDYCRTGVNTILMPGCKVGPYSIIGPGVLLHEDVPNGTLVMLKQELVKSKWGHEKYGW